MTSTPTPRRARVLVLDDEPMIGRLVQRSLGADYDVEVLSYAREALDRILAGERYDIILCDVMMPDLTGPEVHAELAREVPAQAAVMVFMTAGAATKEIRAALDQTGAPRITKPFEVADLVAFVRARVPGQ